MLLSLKFLRGSFYKKGFGVSIDFSFSSTGLHAYHTRAHTREPSFSFSPFYFRFVAHRVSYHTGITGGRGKGQRTRTCLHRGRSTRRKVKAQKIGVRPSRRPVRACVNSRVRAREQKTTVPLCRFYGRPLRERETRECDARPQKSPVCVCSRLAVVSVTKHQR